MWPGPLARWLRRNSSMLGLSALGSVWGQHGGFALLLAAGREP